MNFKQFMEKQCTGCAYELIHDPEHCTECGMRFKAAWDGGYANCKQDKHKQTV